MIRSIRDQYEADKQPMFFISAIRFVLLPKFHLVDIERRMTNLLPIF